VKRSRQYWVEGKGNLAEITGVAREWGSSRKVSSLAANWKKGERSQGGPEHTLKTGLGLTFKKESKTPWGPIAVKCLHAKRSFSEGKKF